MIGRRMSILREQKHLSQQDVATRVGLTTEEIAQIEADTTVPSLDTLEAIAQALEVSLPDLFLNGDIPPRTPHLPDRLTADDIAISSQRDLPSFRNQPSRKSRH